MKKSYRSEFIQKLEGGVAYERDILNILLSNAYNGKDMSGVTDKLLARFPSVNAILSASAEELTAVDGVSEGAAMYLKAVGLAASAAECNFSEIEDCEHFQQTVRRAFFGKDNEFAQFYLVNSRGKIIAFKEYTSGSADKVEMHTDEFLSILNKCKPYGIYLAHNHVNCSCRPSLSDDAITRKIATVCAACNVRLFEHCIVNTAGEVYSYFSSGRLAEITAAK